MNRYDKELIASMFNSSKISWGFLKSEYARWYSDETMMTSSQNEKNIPGLYNYLQNYVKLDKPWGQIHQSLLQPHKNASPFTTNRNSCKRQKHASTARLLNETRILSHDESSAWARILFEIKEDIAMLRVKKYVGKNCGYLIAKKIYDEGSVRGKDLSRGKSVYPFTMKKRVWELYQVGIINEAEFSNENEYTLRNKFERGFDLMYELEDNIKNWKYRTNWIFPARKI